MNKYSLTEYAPLFVDKEKARTVFEEIMSHDPKNYPIEIDVTGIESMTTVCAKIIFGSIVREIGESTFYSNISFKGLTDELELIINMGIESAVEKKDDY